MKSGIITILKKELARFFGDKRMVVSILIPGVLVYIMYCFMGDAMGSAFGVSEDYVPSIQAVEMSSNVKALLGAAEISVEDIPETGLADAKAAVIEQSLDLLLVFPENFDQDVAEYAASSGQAAPNVEIYYNSASTNSTFVYRTMAELLDAYESQMVN